MAYDPVQSLVAVGSDVGTVTVYGRPDVEVRFELPNGGVVSVLKFAVNQVCVGGARSVGFSFFLALCGCVCCALHSFGVHVVIPHLHRSAVNYMCGRRSPLFLCFGWRRVL